MQERRKFKRIYLVFYTRVFDASSGRLVGHLCDLSPEGMLLISEQPNPANQEFHMTMELPESVFGKERLEFKARSVWCKPDLTPEFHMTGFQLLEIQPDDKLIVERIIKEYGIRG